MGELKRIGRPRLDPSDVSVDVHFRLTAKQYDAAERRAVAARLTLADYLRQVVARANRGEPPR